MCAKFHYVHKCDKNIDIQLKTCIKINGHQGDDPVSQMNHQIVAKKSFEWSTRIGLITAKGASLDQKYQLEKEYISYSLVWSGKLINISGAVPFAHMSNRQ